MQGFTAKDFKIMNIEGLTARMEGIQTEIQPKFQALGQTLTDYLSLKLGDEMHLHIARHARRSVNPPESTWFAISSDKRGYKKHPHFQVGLYDDYLFVWLAFIYENQNRINITSQFLNNLALFKKLPQDYVLSKDHTVKKTYPLHSSELEQALMRFKDIKKGEFLVGKKFSATDQLLANGTELERQIKVVFASLLPLYKLALK